ncbi:polysaccharide pyruvyl transferase family protein [Pseudomonas sp. p1(2021b)]|uniref:polysaccharide pyruvyl transferase family protein n=1 Tax=Pseudomonas sp. p1(2021b) TaxID=2874628 RepID=UPI001CC957F1|nr:polysaccharide pyruvyl transferase family protein [Pseudomonas sp. p1(2021b)]UBM26566.1 polysaccharide pyruvyl transferase family protein [Pseudomonas sp. p1(2021b)]
MKIALITIHYANSYGGCLQAAATQAVLSRYGEVTILDYKTKDLGKTLNVLRLGFGIRDFLRVGKDIVRFFPRKRLISKFKKFIYRYYKLSRPIGTVRDLKAAASKFDVFVCGSDQIWNPNIVGAQDFNYVLEFADGKKISLSSSMGSFRYSGKGLAEFKKKLSSFSHIAVREKDLAEELSVELDREVVNTLDPTLLLDKVQWFDLLGVEADEREKYIFVYTLKKTDFICRAIDKISMQLGLKVVVIDQDPFIGFKCDRHVMDASPEDYVKLIAGSSFVLTNSFHGTAFAVNFAVPFITLPPESGVNRIQSLLDSVGLRNRMIDSIDSIDELLKLTPDFTGVENKLEALRIETFKYLDKAMRE